LSLTWFSFQPVGLGLTARRENQVFKVRIKNGYSAQLYPASVFAGASTGTYIDVAAF
jgi:hypothetical protein